jgi:hypothetical protein
VVGVYGSVISVNVSNWITFAKQAVLRSRTRRELKRLKADQEKLRQAVFQIGQAKSAIKNWSEKNK